MLRATKATLIIKRELETGLVVKKVDPSEKFLEYWIYEDYASGTINSRTGEYMEASAGHDSAQGRTLKCVIVCENEESHIVVDKDLHFLVKGFIFSDQEYPDLTDYLGRTERHL
jgi:hypothetical protein